MNDIIIIFAPQEYKDANHKYLWHSLAKEGNTEVLILDIPADYLITTFKKKWYRFQDNKKGLIYLEKNINKYRPVFPIRPEVTPRLFNFMFKKSLKRQLNKYYDVNDYNISFIVYDPKWVRIVKGFSIKTKVYYYILDELKLHAHNDKENKNNIIDDEFACANCDHIFSMSDAIKANRYEYREKITVVGNGSIYKNGRDNKISIKKSIGFVGNFRNWIDKELLRKLVEYRADLLFCFVGPVEENMKNYMSELLNSYQNTAYFGIASKEEISNHYKMFDVVIVPYRQNNFMQGTRPIKIVEAVFSGTPVISIPMGGYKENSFIKFATNYDEFSQAIDDFLEKPINIQSHEYRDFIKENSWESKSKIIYNIIRKNINEGQII